MSRLQNSRVRRRTVLKYGGASAISACLAGCQSPSDGQGSRNEVVGSGQNNLPLSGQTISIGSLAADMEWPLGADIAHGSEVAVQQINRDGGLVDDGTDQGGILGAELEHHTRDTGLSPTDARRGHRELVQKEGVDMTTGIFLDNCLMAIFPEMSRTETIHITSGSPDPKAGELVHSQYDRFKYHFRTGSINSNNWGRFLVDFLERYAEQLRWHKVALLSENLGPLHGCFEYLTGQDFGAPLEGYEDKALEDVDAIDEVVMSQQTSSGTSNWSPIFDEVEAADTDLALITFVLTGTPAVNQWANEKRQFEMGGIHLWSMDPAYWGELDGRIEGLWTGTAYTPQTINTPTTEQYLREYAKVHNSTPLYPGGTSYDAINMYCQAVANAVVEEGFSEVPHADAVVPYLEDLTWSGSVIFDNQEWEFISKDHPTQAHDGLWQAGQAPNAEGNNALWPEEVPVMQQWQYDPEIRKDYGTQHSIGPWQNRTSDYVTPEWIDKEPEGDRWMDKGAYEDEVPVRNT